MDLGEKNVKTTALFVQKKQRKKRIIWRDYMRPAMKTKHNMFTFTEKRNRRMALWYFSNFEI